MKIFLIGGKKVTLDQILAIYMAGHFIRMKWLTDNESKRQEYATNIIADDYYKIKYKLKTIHKKGEVSFINFNELDFVINYKYSH